VIFTSRTLALLDVLLDVLSIEAKESPSSGRVSITKIKKILPVEFPD
jgi:hypothetical protein